MAEETQQISIDGSDSPAAAAADSAAGDGNAFPPPGWVDRDGACRIFGITFYTWKDWIKRRKIRCGKWFLHPAGRWLKLYPIESLEQMRADMESEDQVREDPQRPGHFILPEGYVTRDEAARMLGIGPDTMALWFTNGKVRCGKTVKAPGGRRWKIYPVEGLKLEMQKMEDARPKVPEGYVDIEGACRMFSITKAAWNIWKREGKVPRGLRWRSRDNMPCRIYRVDELQKIMQFMRGPDQVYMLPGGSAQFHIPEGFVRTQDAAQMFGVDYKALDRWESEGRITSHMQGTGRRLKLYRLDQVKRLLEECGRYSPPYPDPQRPGVYRVPLAGHDMVRREAIIDGEDLHLVEGRSWHCPDRGPDQQGDVSTSNRGGTTRMHHIIMGISGDDVVVGHLNEDPLDCRRANLIVRTRSEKNAHRRKGETFRGEPCSSRFKGVCWDKRREAWIASIKKDGKNMNLGRFGDEIAAAQAYDEAARELFGEHSRPNFPSGVDAWLDQQAQELKREAA